MLLGIGHGANLRAGRTNMPFLNRKETTIFCLIAIKTQWQLWLRLWLGLWLSHWFCWSFQLLLRDRLWIHQPKEHEGNAKQVQNQTPDAQNFMYRETSATGLCFWPWLCNLVSLSLDRNLPIFLCFFDLYGYVSTSNVWSEMPLVYVWETQILTWL